MNMNTEFKSLTDYAGSLGNSAYAVVNGIKYSFGAGKVVLLDHAEMGMYHIQVMSGTDAWLEIEGLEFE